MQISREGRGKNKKKFYGPSDLPSQNPRHQKISFLHYEHERSFLAEMYQADRCTDADQFSQDEQIQGPIHQAYLLHKEILLLVSASNGQPQFSPSCERKTIKKLHVTEKLLTTSRRDYYDTTPLTSDVF